MSDVIYVLKVPASYSKVSADRAKADVEAQLGDGKKVVVIIEGANLYAI